MKAIKVDLDTIIEDPRWDSLLKNKKRWRKIARCALEEAAEEDGKYEISLLLADDERVHALNKQYRDKDAPTNVLSFAFGDDENHQKEGDITALGDIVLSYDTLARESEENGKSLRDHAIHLYVHGILHLLGYDHVEDEDQKVMENLEIHILNCLDIANPYE